MRKIKIRYFTLLVIFAVILISSTCFVTSSYAKSSKPSAIYYDLARWYSPVIVQYLEHTCFADYITRINYDGNYIGNDNWDHLATCTSDWTTCKKSRLLPACVYYSVIETETHYFICYALFHPADDFKIGLRDQHENDLEGIVMCVYKDGTTYGKLRMVQLQSHWDYYQYFPTNTFISTPGAGKIAEAAGIKERGSDVDSLILLDYTYKGVHPVVYVESGGHGLWHLKLGKMKGPYVRYYYKNGSSDEGKAEDPDVVGYKCVSYDLLSISAEMWERRKSYCGYGCLFDKKGDYVGGGPFYGKPNYIVKDLGKKFDGDKDGSEPGEDAASPPWNWKDGGDGWWTNGDWFLDPAGYHEWQFYWSESFSIKYTFHPFLKDHLGGQIYNGKGGTTTLFNGPYNVVCNTDILTKQTLVVKPGITLKFSNNTKIIANGTLRAYGGSGTVKFIQSATPGSGIKLNAGLRLQNGGGIKF